jgi:hypothetical protein
MNENYKLIIDKDTLRQIEEIGALIPCASGGTFENDPPDAILEAARQVLTWMLESGVYKLSINEGDILSATYPQKVFQPNISSEP